MFAVGDQVLVEGIKVVHSNKHVLVETDIGIEHGRRGAGSHIHIERGYGREGRFLVLGDKANVVVETDTLLDLAADGPLSRQRATVPENDKQRRGAPRQGFAVSGHGSPATDTISPKRSVLQKRPSVGTTTTSPLLSRILLSRLRPFSTSE